MDDRRSDRFGRYEILTELGRGAMGIVYKARDPSINRIVAVKTISLAGQPPGEERSYRERFVREAEAAGRLSHPGIVTIFDVGEETETRAPYIVMEFVGGQSLEHLLAGGDHKLSLEMALHLTLELAQALDYAHAQGVVHRDLKPANILLTEDGHAKIADFGVAKLNLANQTLAGRAMGTPAYMSPEQLNGEAVDGRSDLFSLGVILYTVLTGYRPFQGNSAITVSFKVVNRDPIPATLLDSELPRGLDYIITRAMAKDPARRYQRGMEMVLDIQHLRAGREPGSTTTQPALNDRGLAAKSRSSTRALPPGDDAKALWQMIRLRALTAALFVVVLVALGLWVASFGPPRGSHRYSEPSPPPPSAAKVSAAAEPATPVPSVDVPADTAPVAIRVASPRKAAVLNHSLNHSKTVPRVSSQTVPPVVALAVPPALPPAQLEIEITHKFPAGHLSVWVDDRLTYTHLLEGTDKRRLVMFHQVQGHEFHNLQIASGTHRLRVQVTSDSPAYDQSATVDGDFASEQQTVLRVNFSKRGEMSLSLQ